MLIDLWVDALLRDAPPPITPADGMLVTRLADAFYRSSRDRCETKLSSAEP